MNNGLKVYYCPLLTFFDQDVWPTLFAFFPLFRSILIREEINVVHTHQATSVMSIECALYARTMGYVVFYRRYT
jgi:phosphatidylinositol glycan class A protein